MDSDLSRVTKRADGLMDARLDSNLDSHSFLAEFEMSRTMVVNRDNLETNSTVVRVWRGKNIGC